jgi:tetratricopeptide (TPR) repeat protein
MPGWKTDAPLAGRYRLARPLGQGGMGQVHAAHDTLLERQVAIKTLGHGPDADPLARPRLRREALAAAALDHPFICKIFEVGEHDGRDFIVMEYVEGRTLDALIADRSITPRQVLDIAHELSQALEEAHRRGIVHRDLKPSNIMVSNQGHVKVLDFGIARRTPPVQEDAATQALSGESTEPGTRLGTLAYMSPEQVLGSPLDPRSDVFSLGVIFHELASGQHPFRRPLPADTMAAILRDRPVTSPAELDVVPGFGAVVHRMLSKACAERYQSMRELAAELDVLRTRSVSGTAGSGGTTGPGLRDERTEIVARDVELAELARQLDVMLLGEGGLVLLGGEPGVGKTRLARELLRLARTRGCFVAIGQCYEQEGAPPFGPFLEIMDQGLRAVPQAVRAALGDAASELSLLFPVLRRTFADIPEPPAIPAEQQRTVVFNAHLDYLRRACAKSPLVLLFDDLHWADEPTLQLLLHVAPHLSSIRLLVAGTYRDVELDTQRPFARTLETLLRQRLARRLSLRRLGAGGVEQMLAAMSGSAPPASLVKVVHGETDGNPFFVEEVFQHLREEGKLFDADGRWRTDLRVEDLEVPEGVRLVIGRRLDRLGDEARRLLTAAAVVGRSFPLDLLHAIGDLGSEDAVLDIVEQAERAQLLQAERGREARYTFVHELIRTTLLTGLSLPRRQRMHLRIAEAIERLRTASIDTQTSMLAHHLYQAGAAADSDRAVRVLLRAMQRAYDAGAFEEALELAERIESYELSPGSAELGTLMRTKGGALASLGRVADATALAERAFVQAAQAHDDAGIAWTTRLLADVYGWHADITRSLSVAARGLAALSPDAASERSAIAAAIAPSLAGAGRFGEAWAGLGDAERIASGSGDRELVALVAAGRCRALRATGRLREAVQEAARALGLLGDSYASPRGNAAAERLLSLFLLGDYPSLDRELPEAAALGRRIGHGGLSWITGLLSASLTLVRKADLAAWRQFNQTQLEKPFQWRFLSRWFCGDTAFLMGDLATARAEMQQAIEERPDTTVWVGRLLEVNLFAFHAWAGEHDTARGLWREAAREMPAAGEEHVHSREMGLHAAIGALALVGEREACGALYPAAEASLASELAYTSLSLGPTSPTLAVAIAAEAAGLGPRARAHFEEALRIATSKSIRLLSAVVKLWFGRHLIACGGDDRARGRRLLDEAQQEFAAIGMALHRGYAERWLADAPA